VIKVANIQKSEITPILISWQNKKSPVPPQITCLDLPNSDDIFIYAAWHNNIHHTEFSKKSDKYESTSDLFKHGFDLEKFTKDHGSENVFLAVSPNLVPDKIAVLYGERNTQIKEEIIPKSMGNFFDSVESNSRKNRMTTMLPTTKKEDLCVG
jgi:hypothetical protein